MLLAELRLRLGGLDRLGDQVVDAFTVCGSLVSAVLCGALVLSLLVGLGVLLCLLISCDEDRCLFFAVNLGDAGVFQIVEIVFGELFFVDLIRIWLEIVVVLVFRIVLLAVAVVVGLGRLDVVASKVDGVSSRDLEPDTLILADGNVKRLLVALRKRQ